jgi:hypothetical protein
MYVAKEMYAETTHCKVHSIIYRYNGVCYPLYSMYNTGVLRERRGIEYDITGTFNVYSDSRTLFCILKDTHPADETEYVNSSLTRADYGTPR